MLYKFDILFRKVLANGGVKVVTYSQLLENPKAFGEKENLEEVTGKPSVVKEGIEKGYSVNSLLLKYHSQMIGRANADIWVKEFPLEFSFADSDDVTSIKADVKNERDCLFFSETKTNLVPGEQFLDLTYKDTCSLIIVQQGQVQLADDNANILHLSVGEIALVLASTANVTFTSSSSATIKTLM